MKVKTMNDKLGIFSFFAGAGFLDLGFEKTGFFETLFANEYHKPFMDIYKGARKNIGIQAPKFGHHVNDINDFLAEKKLNELKDNINISKKEYKAVGFIGGPPCPDFSVGGKNRGKEGDNGRLSGIYTELICKTKPDFFLFENVKGLWRTKKHREFYESLKEKFISSGYLLTERLINSIEYGVPQDRDRIILIGFSDTYLKANAYNSNGTPYLWNFDWEYGIKYDKTKIFNLPWQKSEKFIENSNRARPIGVPEELTIQYWFNKNDVDNHKNQSKHFTPRAGLVKFQSIEEGDDCKKSYKRLHRWRYSPTAAYGNNEVHLHPFKARRISVAEALAIQSLPKDFIIPNEITLSNSFKAIGNGVPFVAAKGLAITILNFFNEFVDKEYKLNGEVNSTKPSLIYKPTPKAKQLSVFEPKEQGTYSS
jgi:DNA (cytosine-5)-methyltransferase 1